MINKGAIIRTKKLFFVRSCTPKRSYPPRRYIFWHEIKVAVSDVTATVGRVVSTKYLALSVTAVEVMVAWLPLASLRVALFKLSALMAIATPLASVCPAVMVVVKTSAVVPEPET